MWSQAGHSNCRPLLMFWLSTANNGGTSSTCSASRPPAPQSCGIFAATRPRWAPKGLTLGACSIFRGSGAAGASAALQLAAASQAAGCSCGAPAQKRQKKRRICGPLCGKCMWPCLSRECAVFSGASGQERRSCSLQLARPPQAAGAGSARSSSTGATEN